MSHILIVGAGPAGLAAALRLAERGQRMTLAAARPPIYNRCAGLPGIDLPEEDAQTLRAMGAQNLSGHEVMQALSRKLLRYESDGHIRYLPYHRLVRLTVAEGACAGGVLLNEHTDTVEGVTADAVLLATGGMHSMFAENRFGCDGAAAALAFQAGAALSNPDQLPGGGRYPVCTGGLITSWDGETTLPGLYAAGECANGTAQAFPFAQAMTTGAAAADALSETLPEIDSLEAECSIASAVTRVQQQVEAFRQTRGTRAPAAVEQRIRDTIQRVLAGERTAKILQRGLLDIKVMRQQAGRGGYDLGEGLYFALRLPMLLEMLEVMLTTAAFRLLRQDGDLTAVMKEGKIEVTAKRSAAVEAAAQNFGLAPKAAPPDETGQEGEAPPSLKDDLWRANAPVRPHKAPAVQEEKVGAPEAPIADPAELDGTIVLRPEEIAAIPAAGQTPVFNAAEQQSLQEPAAAPEPERETGAAPRVEARKISPPLAKPCRPEELAELAATPMLDADLKRLSAIRSTGAAVKPAAAPEQKPLAEPKDGAPSAEPAPAGTEAAAEAAQAANGAPEEEPKHRAYELFTPDPEDLLALTPRVKPEPPAMAPGVRDFTTIPDPEELLKRPSDR